MNAASQIALSGARLFFVGLLTGLWSAAALTGKVSVSEPHLALAAHLNALLGGLWLLAVASTAPHLDCDERGLRRLANWIRIPAWANWLVTLIASFLGVKGIDYTGNHANDAIAFLLQASVVLPSFVGGILWLRSFRRARG